MEYGLVIENEVVYVHDIIKLSVKRAEIFYPARFKCLRCFIVCTEIHCMLERMVYGFRPNMFSL